MFRLFAMTLSATFTLPFTVDACSMLAPESTRIAPLTVFTPPVTTAFAPTVMLPLTGRRAVGSRTRVDLDALVDGAGKGRQRQQQR